ncbi:T9SS type B sorting domain-containing protein [Empedobacter falsenii]|uniref:T9SS type B sorting domain-containing protein n=1 Tax=Empedobacter falsenii TaxID=343874 RepID=UPI002574F092|nr:T9SS type B sorting domain-containing protein [Empedobacter falsenii]MDM1297901.1 T9SS type B sorting domain-containing protein [Empedobacter falsenii]MDM1317471.1 T9SS type B sorting domain-containing protein [Empedobacter falsenii]
MNFFNRFFLLLSCFFYFAFAQKEVHISKCLDYNFSDDLFIETPNNLDEIQEEFYEQNPSIDATKYSHDGAVYRTIYTTTRYPNIRRTYTIDDGEKERKIFYLKFIENTMNNPRESFAVRVIYNRSRNPSSLNGEAIYGCLEGNFEKYDLTKNQFIESYIETGYLNFSFYKNQTDMNLDQNMIPESEWSNYIISTTDEHKVYLKISFNDSSKKCVSYSTINLKLKDYSTQMGKTEFEFCGTPFVVNGPENQSNYEWYFNGDLKSTKKEVQVDALGQWIVYFDNDLGCKSSVKINVIPEKERSRIEKVTATSNSITIIPFPNANIDSYSLDGITFQNSGTFFNQTADLISIWYKTKLGCVFGPIPFDIANGFNFLSPNGDGINDTWSLRNKDFYKNAKIQIFDRYGKIVANGIVNDILPWNGKHNNFVLPTGAYWFIIKDDKETLKTGYIVLKTK